MEYLHAFPMDFCWHDVGRLCSWMQHQDSTTGAVSAALSTQKITFTDITTTSMVLHWTTSSLVTTPSYQVYYTATAPDKSVLPAAVLANWVPVGASTAGSVSTTVSGLTENTVYYFTVVVEDTTKKAIGMYTVTSATTTADGIAALVPGAAGALTFTGATTTGFTVEWAQATDADTPQASLSYQVFYATSLQNVDSAAHAQASVTASLAAASTPELGISGYALTSLTPNTLYYVLVVVEDGATPANVTAYNVGSFSTLLTPDTIAPTTASATLSASSVKNSSLTLTWTKATDDQTAQSALQYQVFYASGSTDITTVSNALANGTAVFGSNGSLTWQTDINTAAISGLSTATAYHFTVLVRDTAGNMTAYTQLAQSTTSVIYMFSAGSHDGNLKGSTADARTGADAICNAFRTLAYTSICSSGTTHAFISTTSSDYIGNFPTQYTSLPTMVPIIDPFYGYQIATNWSTLINFGPCLSNNTTGSTCNTPGSTAQSLSSLLGASGAPWTGTTINSVGAFDSTNNCSNWTTTAGNGAYGNPSYGATSGRKFFQNGTTSCDSTSLDVYCVCW